MAATAKSWKLGAGKWKTVWYPKVANAAIESGVLLEFAAGYVKEGTTTAGASDTPVAGLYLGPTIASSATTERIPVMVPAEPLATAIGVVDTGTLTAACVGLSYDISATNGVTQSTTTNEAVTCVNYLGAALGEFVLTNVSSPAA